MNDDNYLLSKNREFKVYGSGEKNIKLGEKDNLSYTLKNAGFSQESINEVMSLLNKKINLKTLQKKQSFNILYNSETILQETGKHKTRPKMKKTVENKTITKLSFKTQKGVKYIIEKNDSGYVFQREMPKLIINNRVVSGEIKSNLFTDAVISGIRISTLYNVLNEYTFLIDFQHDLHRNDKFIFVLKTTKDGDGDIIEEKVLYTNLILRKKNYEIFNFNGNFYDRNGRSIQKKLLKTPIDGARITSGFQKKRKHPILGYTRAHKGVDMAAPTGTPIYAAGDGVILQKTTDHDYGNYVLIKHNREYSTKYAHMSRFANVKVGQRVKQRQVIGYVGKTGLATGPHLHYEVIRYGKHINPQTINAVEIKKLSQSKIPEFRIFVANIDNILKD